MMRKRTMAAAMALALGACATVPATPGLANAVAGGRQWLEVRTVRWVAFADPGPGRGWTNLSASRYEALPGAHCVAGNDRGTWSVTTPGIVEVTLSARPLTLTCRLPGYRDETRVLRCLSPATRDALAATGIGGWAAGPIGVLFAAPFFGVAALMAATEGPEDGCVYRTETVPVEMVLAR